MAGRVRIFGCILAVTALLVVGCNLQAGRAGARCSRVGDFAQDGTYLLKCNARHRWFRGITLAQGEQLIAAIKALQAAATATTAAPPAPTTTAAPVPPLTATSVSVGYYLACASLTNGHVACWGQNDHGALGWAATSSSSSVPVVIDGIDSAVSVSASYSSACALLSDASVTCWGWNTFGQLGDGTTLDTPTPRHVGNLGQVVRLVAAGGAACALELGGTVKCWGLHLLTGTGASSDVLTPTSVGGLGTVTDLSLGANHACAVEIAGTVKCWGTNGHEQLGDNSYTDHPTPSAVTGLTNAVSVAVGGFNSCAVLSTGAVDCWGQNSEGEMGDGTSGGEIGHPVPVTGLTSPSTLSVGMYHACVTTLAGDVKCWGKMYPTSAFWSQLPQAVDGAAPAVMVAAGEWLNCTLTITHSVQCWGANTAGQLGAPNEVASSGPRTVTRF